MTGQYTRFLRASKEFGQRSAVGFAAVPDAEHANSLAILVEADPVVARAKAVLGRVDALKPFHVTRPGSGEALDCLLDATGDSFIECAHIFQ